MSMCITKRFNFSVPTALVTMGWNACRKSNLLRDLTGCVKTVSKPLLFGTLEFCLSEKQTPEVVVFSRSGQNHEGV
jgi:hypothetical protein